MSGSEKNAKTQMLYMPAVSIMVPGDRKYEDNQLSYTYTPVVYKRPSIVSQIFSSMVTAFTFVISVFLFAIPVTVASLILLSSMQSPAGTAVQNQDIPGIEKVVPQQEPNNQVVTPTK